MKKISATLILSLLLLCSATFVARAQSYNGIVYVTPTGAGTHSGDSWENATSDIDEAQWIAQVNNAVVWVAAGTYYGDTTSTSENAFIMVEGVDVYGGFAGNEPEDYDLSLRDFAANATILDGQNARRVLYQETHFNNRTVLDGLTIQNGYVNGDGGGAYLLRNTSLANCRFVHNVAKYNYGGGLCKNNYSDTQDTIRNCSFEKNSSGSGGGMYVYGTAVVNCLINNNTSSNAGGGIYCSNNTTIANSTIVRNSSLYDGGGLYASGNMNMVNTVVWGNMANEQINNVYVSEELTPLHCAIEKGWGEDSSVIKLSPNNYGSTEGLDYPLFVSPESGDFRLRNGSALINAGVNTGAVTNIDLAGEARVYDGVVDIGCYEYHGESYCETPVLLTVTDVIGSSAMVKWENANPETPLYYEMSYKMTEDTSWITVGNIQSEYYLLTNLQPKTDYSVRVRLCCSSNVFTNYSAIVNFKTSCLDGELFVTIGETTSTNFGDVLPTNNYYPYSYTQQIYQAEEIGPSKNIDALSFQYYSDNTLTKNLNIYLGHTQKSVFESTSDWIPFSNLMLVYSGSITFSNSGNDGWIKIPLTTSFEYNGLDNLVVVFDDNTGSWTNGDYFYTHSTTGYSSLYVGSNGTNYNPVNPYTTGSMIAYRSNIKLYEGCLENACDRSNVSVAEVTDSSALLLCALGSGAEGYQLEYREQGGDSFTVLPNTGSSYMLTGLQQNTRYEVRIRSLCGSMQSQWKDAAFTTEVINYNRLYVTPEGDGDGGSWATASGDLCWAMNTADRIQNIYGTSPDIWVAAGTYYGDTTATNAFIMKEGVSIYGGFAGNEPADYDLSLRDFAANATILDGQNARRVVYQENPFNTRTVVDGITIQNGNANGHGGGAYLRNNTLLSNCCFVKNVAYNNGGGLYYYGNSHDTIKSCSFSYNSGNTGGGLCLDNVSVINCLVFNNSSDNRGGGVYCSYGGARIENSTIVRNKSVYPGGGLYVVGNTSMTNSVIWGNRKSGTINNVENDHYISCSYSAVEGGIAGNHNIPLFESNDQSSFSPFFVNPSVTAGSADSTANVNWHLQQGSVCINRGGNGGLSSVLDLDGTTRIKRDTVDIGCYESDYYSVPVPQYDGIVYVTVSGAGSNSGDSWANAVSSIADAQAIAQTNHASIWVAAGTYYGDTTEASAFIMKEGVSVYGGFFGNEPSDYDLSQRDFASNPTVLDGQGSRRVFNQSRSFNTRTVLDGFTIQNGYTTGNGAGVYLRHNTRLSNCRFVHNVAQNPGGGLYFYGDYDTIRNCSFESNTGYYGGGLYLSYTRAINCLVVNNSSNVYGGGVYCSYGAMIVNSTIARNSSGNSGGGIYALSDATMVNSVVWGNKRNGETDNLGNANNFSCRYSAVEGGVAGNHNIPLFASNAQSTFSPLFVNPSIIAGTSDNTENVDWHLQQGSVCINRGDNTFVTDSLDLDCTVRIKNDIVDLGCFESDYNGVPIEEYDSIIYVTMSGAGTRSGNCWANATSSIEDAQAIAQSYNAVVWVATGTYYGDTTSSNAFTMKDGVSMFGGFAGNEPADYDLLLRDFQANPTILDGQNSRRVIYQANSFNARTALDGFTIQNGYSTGDGGGALLQHNTQISNCRFVHNVAQNSNYYYSNGGGLYYYGSSYDTIRGCSFENNTSGSYGGGLYLDNANVFNCLFSNNSANYAGGGIYSHNGTITNSTIVRNKSDNSYSSDGGGIYASEATTLINSILWGNWKNDNVNNLSGSIICRYSAVEGDYAGEHNIPLFASNDQNVYSPYFVNPSVVAGATDTTENVDWHLLPNSPCINRGDNSAVTFHYDMDGYERIQYDNVDLGCYESVYPEPSIPVYNNIIYVTETGAGSMTGDSWENATPSIANAMNLASLFNAGVWVAAGTYYGDTLSENAFVLKEGVSVYGGFAGDEPSDFGLSQRNFEVNVTILDGLDSRRVVYQANDFNVRAALDGFTILNGYSSEWGGGAYLRHNTVLSNCRFTHNTSQWGGGGLYFYGQSNDTISNCVFENNHTESNGGGLYLYGAIVLNSLVSNNSSNYGGGIYASGGSIRNSTIVRNISNSGVAGVYGSYSTYLVNSVVWGNRSDGYVSNMSGSVNCRYSAVEGWNSSNNNMISLSSNNYGVESDVNYPWFVSPDDGDYRLRRKSCLINAGTNSYYILPNTDIVGTPRVVGDTVDMGCYEFHGEAYCMSPEYVTVHDITGSSAMLTWQNLDSDGTLLYELSYKMSEDTEWTVVDSITTRYYMLSGLQQLSEYAVRVRTLCDSGVFSYYSETIYFSTECYSGARTVIVGTTNYNMGGGNNIPTNSNWKYSYTQQLYQASELQGYCLIDTLSLQYTGGGITRNVNIYLGHTQKNKFLSNADWVQISDLTLVYSGNLTFNNISGRWMDIPLTTSFEYNGSDNLVLAFDDNTGGYSGGWIDFYTHSTNDNTSLYIRSDGTNYNPAFPNNGTLLSYRNNLKLSSQCDENSCDRANVAVVDITDSSARLVCTLGTGTEGFELAYRQIGQEDYTTLPDTGNTLLLNGLSQNTEYEIRIRSLCGDNRSPWKHVSFTTGVRNLSRLYVTTTGQGEGDSWEEACNDLNRAISIAQLIRNVYGVQIEIWVAAGTYYGNIATNSENAFTMQEGVSVYGGFVGNEPVDYDLSLRDFEANATILDGQNSRRVLYQPNNFTEATAVVWDGFTIQHGRVDGDGAGVFLRSYSTLQHCIVQNNTSYGNYMYGDRHGGGIYANGSYNYTTHIKGCTISHNRIEGANEGSGGGIHVNYATIDNCLISQNEATRSGGGIDIFNGGIVTNSTIVRNTSTYASGAGVNVGYSTGCSLFNCVIWGNRQDERASNIEGDVTCDYSAVEGGASGVHNVLLTASNDLDAFSPFFVNPSIVAGADDTTTHADWRLQPNSPCINRGSNSYVEDSLDIDDHERIQFGRVDMGCYESEYDSIALPEYNGIVYVTVTGGGDHTGNSWSNALSSISEAQALAQAFNAVVWVAAGTYYGDTNATNAFKMWEGVSVYGGFFGDESADYDLSLRDFSVNTTVLDGQDSRRVLCQSADFTSSTAVVWDGFTIQHGRINGDGAGVYLRRYSTLKSCIVQHNSAYSTGSNSYCYGGGVYAYGSYVMNGDNNTIHIIGCTISHNEVGNAYYSGVGGGLYLRFGTVERTEISYNFANHRAGGVYADAHAAIQNCLISQNESDDAGGGIFGDYGVTVTNSTIVRNTSTNASGAGIYGASSDFSIINCVIWGNRHDGTTNSLAGTYNCKYSAVEGNAVGINNLPLIVSNDQSVFSPYFVSPSDVAGREDTTSAVDWRLQSNSPCINRGSNDFVEDSLDIDNHERIRFGRVDMGCYESAEYDSIALPEYNGIVYVTVTGAGDKTGNSWSNALSSIDEAQALAQAYNAVVWVASGTYYGDTLSTNAFNLKSGVSVYGGFVGNEPVNYDLSLRDFETNATILDGRNMRRVLCQPTAFTESSAAIWDGFTIQHGRVNGDGAGAYLRDYSTLQHCRVQYNAVYSDYTSEYRYGGGVCASGSGDNTIHIRECFITHNGIENDNNYNSYGGGIYSSKAIVSNCLIANNSMGYCGGGVYCVNGTIANSTIVRNTAGGDGAGICASGTAYMRNSVVWGNRKTGKPNNVGGDVTCIYSAVEEGFEGDHNVPLFSSNDNGIYSPHFTNPSVVAGWTDSTEGVDWGLLPNSPCINKGINSYVVDSLDLEGHERIQQDTVDMGCYESEYYGIRFPEYNNIIYVTETGAGSKTGESWETALSSLVDAQIIAQTYNAVIWVATGTYYGDTLSENAFVMKERVSVYGGFAGNEPADYDLSLRDFETNATILDGLHARRVLYQPDDFSSSAAVTWDGFTIQNGRIKGDGAGVYLRGSSSLHNCLVQYNAAYNENSNESRYGGGVYALRYTGNVPQISHCKILYNVVENTSYGFAGGLYTYYAKVSHTEIAHNSSTYRGGGVFSSGYTTFSNCLIHNNVSATGGGIYNQSSGCNYVNCDIVSNMGGGVYNNSSSTFTNCIVWGNKKNYMVNNYSGGSYSYCAVEEGVSGTGNIALASTNDGNDASRYYVRFNDPENEDFSLHPTSSCVNVGSNTSVTDSLDFYGNPRIHNEVVDIGCSEAASDSTCSSVVNLMVSNVTTNSALLSWHPMGNETQWAVAWQEMNGGQTTVTVTDTFLTLSGLTFNRNYIAKVRAICDSSMMSIFSIPVYFQTDCDPNVLDTLSNFTSLMPEDSIIVYQYRVSFSWSSLPEATSYDFYLWPATSSEPSVPTLSGLTISSLSNYQLPNYQYGKEYHWKVVAWNECISKSSEVQVIRVNKLPDLHVSQVSTSNPVAGQPLTVTWTVVNDGEGNTPPGVTWTDYIWLAHDADVRVGDNNFCLATTTCLHSLNAGESYTNTFTVTVPDETQGNYYLFVMSNQNEAFWIDFSPCGGFAPDPYMPSATGDPYPYLNGSYHGNVNPNLVEVNNHDNFFYKVLNILPPPSPDLVVSSVTHPVNVFSGSQIPVTWTVSNQGEAAAVGSWYDAVYISDDTVLNTATDLRLGRFLHEGDVLIDSTYTHTEQLTIPIQYMGDYYFFVVTDYLNDIYEGLWETNNTGISNHPLNVTLTPPADLTVTSMSLPDTLNANREYQCSYTVKNVGYSVTYGNFWKDVIYLSQDSVFVRDNARQLATRYHSGALMADSSYNDVFSFIVPSDISGWWYLYISTDDDNQIFEYLSEDNNVVKRTPALLVNIPDLTVSNVVVPDTVDPNGTTLVRWTIRNNGPGDVVNRTFSDCFTFDGEVIYNGYMSNINLNAGGTISRSAVVKIPCHDSGNSSLTITTDCLENVLEGNENNNSHTVALNLLTPDLAVTGITAPDTMWSGTVLPETNTTQEDYSGVSYQIHNHGSMPVVGKVVTDRIYLSLSANHFQESDLLISNTHTITLAPNETQTYSCAVPIPNGINGHYYFHVVCNVGDSICEVGNTSDNVGHSTITTLHLSPWADLVVSQVHVQDTTYIGATFPVSYTIRNNGTAPLNQAGVYQKFYYSTSPTSYDNNNLLLTKYDVLTLDQGAEVTNLANVALPSSQLQRYYYIHVVADATDLVYEHTGENNNTAVSNSFFGKNYLLDLAAVEIDGPDVVQWGQTATYRLHVSNNSALPSLLSQWQDALYLSNDVVLNNTDLLQQMVNHNSVLNAGDDYWADFQVTIPFGTPSSAYLLGFADYYSQNPDVNYSNNSTVKNITVNSVPTPDLAVTEMMVLDEVVSGQPARLVYTVLNAGELDISNLTWNDRIYFSLDSTYQNTDIELATQNRQNMSLAVGEYYTDTLTFTIPLPYHGGLYVLAVANATNQPYEVVRSNNVGDAQVSVTLPLPGDLIVTDVLSQDSIVSGQMLHATWNIRNVGDYPLAGNGLRTLVYVSRDTLFDVNDRLLGSVTTSISLAVDAVMPQSLNARISGLPEGDYFLMVKTDVNNAFHEVNESNNSGCSIMPFRLSVRPLPFNTDVPDTLHNNEVSDFKLAVGDNIGQTVRIHLASEDSLAGAVNMIYATYNDMGDNLNYSYSTIGQHTANPELYIPSTKVGYYGVNVYGSTPVDNTQSTVIRADILPFELLTVDANHGGNTGFVTVELTGSHFRPDMKVCFRNDNDTIYPDSLIYVNYYKAFAKFDLRDRTPGLYDVSAVNFCEGEATLADAFTIENGQPSGLAYNLIFPNSPRPNRNIVMMLEYGNIGNVDLHDQMLEITSMGGCPIALTPEALSQNITTLQVPLTIEGEPAGLLRPGSYGTVNIYCYSSNALIFSIKPVEE